MTVGLTLDLFTDILFTLLLVRTMIIGSTINRLTDFIQEKWMSLTDIATFMTIVKHVGNSLTVKSVFTDMFFLDIDECGFEFGVTGTMIAQCQTLFLGHVWIVQYTLTSLG